ncbi:MAG: MFS transporter [Thermoplasmatales archaeon]
MVAGLGLMGDMNQTSNLSYVEGIKLSFSRKQIAAVIILALLGWSLASYDFNLVVVSLPAISSALNISALFIGFLFFGIYAGMWAASTFVGIASDKWGRKNLWMIILAIAATFTGFTAIVQNFTELLIVRMIASGFAMSELVVSSTYVNEVLSDKHRSLLYSIVQGGWPLGVFLASLVYVLVEPIYGWRVVFLFGIIPLAAVAAGRFFLPESARFEHLSKVKQDIKQGKKEEVDRLLQIAPVKTTELKHTTIRQVFSKDFGLRRQIIILILVWVFFGFAWLPGNSYITYWLTTIDHFTSVQAATMLLYAGGFGFLFYVLGGFAGEYIPKKYVMGITASFVALLYLIFPHLSGYIAVFLGVFFIAQVTNGSWSGVGFTYNAESFPTRARATAEGLVVGAYSASFAFGSLLWGVLFTVGPYFAWYILGVGFGLGLLLIFAAKTIKPGVKLEDVAY